MTPSPTERQFDPARAKLLREKVEAGQAITFNWAIAKVDDKEYRVNGNHSSTTLSDFEGQFPEGLKVHIDTYKVDSFAGLALLFRQIDWRRGARNRTDVSGAYQGLYTDLAEVPRGVAKLAVEGVAWYDKNVEGLPAPKGDDIYTLFGKTGLHGFIRWVGEVFSIKTPELRRNTIVAAMHGTFDKNEEAARTFWRQVSRGGVEFEESDPTTVLDTFLKSIVEDKRKLELKPANFYQACIYAWNAFREGKTISSVKYDTKKGLYQVAA
jgi:hypothetical protein